MIKKIGIAYWVAWEGANTRKEYCARNPIIFKAIYVARLKKTGYCIVLNTMGLFVCKHGRRRIPNGTDGSVGGRLTR